LEKKRDVLAGTPPRISTTRRQACRLAWTRTAELRRDVTAELIEATVAHIRRKELQIAARHQR